MHNNSLPVFGSLMDQEIRFRVREGKGYCVGSSFPLSIIGNTNRFVCQTPKTINIKTRFRESAAANIVPPAHLLLQVISFLETHVVGRHRVAVVKIL